MKIGSPPLDLSDLVFSVPDYGAGIPPLMNVFYIFVMPGGHVLILLVDSTMNGGQF